MTYFHLRKGLGHDAKKSNKNSTKATFSTTNQQTRDVPDQLLLAEKAPSAEDAPAKQHCQSEPGAQQVSGALSRSSPGVGEALVCTNHPFTPKGFINCAHVSRPLRFFGPLSTLACPRRERN